MINPPLTTLGFKIRDQGTFMWQCPCEKDSLFEGFGEMAMRAIRSKRKHSV